MARSSSRVLVGRAWAGAATLVTVAGIALGLVDGNVPATVACVAGLVAVATGWVVVDRAPTSAVGPALAWSSAGVACVMLVEILAGSAYEASPYPLAALVRPLWVGIWPLNLAGVMALLLVFPEGRLTDRRWWAVACGYAVGTGLTVASSWGAREVDNRIVDGPSGTWAAVTGLVGVLTIGACLVATVVGVVARYRHSDPLRREQIRYLMVAAIVTVAALMLGWVALALGAPLGLAFTPFLVGAVVLLPVAVGVAIVRHDLFDVDRVLSTTTAWALTLLLSAAVYAAVVLAASRTLGASTGVAPTIAAFVTALALLPLQRHVASATGRLVDRDSFVAVSLVERFAAEVRAGTRAPEDVEEVLREAQRDPGLRLALVRPDGTWADLQGQETDLRDALVVRSHGSEIARIALGHDSVRARRRATSLARAGWVPIEVSRLRLGLRDALAETEASRERVAAANAVERRRLERDLHDGVQPRLVATGMRLRSLQRHLAPAHSAEIDVAVGELETTVAELRRLAHGVRPSRLDDGLPAALASLRAEEPVPVHVSVGELPALDDVRALTAFFVASEAVANAHKHAHASRIEVCVEAEDGRLVVEVRDDGAGGVAANGLLGLRDRLQPLHGDLFVASPVGQGTRVRAVF